MSVDRSHPLVKIVEPHTEGSARLAMTALDAVPDGWAKLNGEWITVAYCDAWSDGDIHSGATDANGIYWGPDNWGGGNR